MSKIIDVNKEKRIEIFEDTYAMTKNNKYLKEKTTESIKNTKLYKATHSFEEKECPNKKGQIIVKNTRSFAALDLFSENVKKPCVLNFASATNPGGGVKNGSNAQEECLCRCSTLYPTLTTKDLFENYYKYHRDRKDTLYTNTMIYTPNIVVFKKDDKLPILLENEKWKTCDIITSAAPNLRINSITDKELLDLMKSRIRCILNVAIENKVDGIVLGAFGCGAFKCSPNVVARAFKDVLVGENYKVYFEEIIFAVLGIPNKDMQNFEIFNRVFPNK